MVETPLETARRVWPGEWEHYPHLLRRVFHANGRACTLASITYTSDGYYYAETARVLSLDDMPISGGRDLATVVRDLRDLTQTRIRLLADAAGVTT